MPVGLEEHNVSGVSSLSPLSKEEQRYGLKNLMAFFVLNGINYNIFLGCTTAVFLLQLGASATQIGIQSSVVSLSIPLALFGALLVDRFSAKYISAICWCLRSLVVVPLVFIPWLQTESNTGIIISCSLVCLILYSAIRSIGSPAFMPMQMSLMPERLRTKLTARTMFLGAATSIATIAFVAVCLASETKDTPLWRYQMLFTIGSIVGIASSVLLWRIPSPGQLFRPSIKQAYARTWVRLQLPPVIRFAFSLAVVVAVCSAIIVITVMYLKKIAGLSSQQIVILGVIASIGNCLFAWRMRKSSSRFSPTQASISMLLVICIPAIMGLIIFYTQATGILAFAIASVLYFSLGAVSPIYAVRYSVIAMEIAPKNSPATFIAIFNIHQTIGALFGGITAGYLLDSFTGGDTNHSNYITIFLIYLAVAFLLTIITKLFPLPDNLIAGLHRVNPKKAKQVNE